MTLIPMSQPVTAICYEFDARFDAPTVEVVDAFFDGLARTLREYGAEYISRDDWGLVLRDPRFDDRIMGVHFSETAEGRRALSVAVDGEEVRFAPILQAFGVPAYVMAAIQEQAKRCARYMRGEGYDSQFNPTHN